MARASASAASAGRGGSVSRSSRVTIWRDLGLVRPAAAGHRRLDLARRVQRHRQAAPGRAHDRDRARLRRAHHRAHVVLAEHPLDRDRVRPVVGQPLLDLLLEREQPGADLVVGRRAAPRRSPPGVSVRPGSPSTTPSPHRVRPGSTPSTRIAQLHHPRSLSRTLPRANICSDVTLPARRAARREAARRVGGRLRGLGPQKSSSMKACPANALSSSLVGAGVAARGQAGPAQRGQRDARVQRGEAPGPEPHRPGASWPTGRRGGVPGAWRDPWPPPTSSVHRPALPGRGASSICSRTASVGRGREAAPGDGRGGVHHPQHPRLALAPRRPARGSAS